MRGLPNSDTKTHWIGMVEDVENDPLELGRIKCRIVNQDDNGTTTPTEDLQWCTIMGPTTSSSDGHGMSPTWIQVGTLVVGFYLDGQTKRMPIIQGTLYTIRGGDINNHGVNKLARGENSITKEPIGPEPPSKYAAKYPFNKVMSTPGGHVIEMDDTPGAERVHIYHKSGSYIEFDFEGDTVRRSNGNDITVVVKDQSVHVEGASNVYVKGDAVLKIDGSFTTEVAGDYEVTAGGNMKFNASRIDLNG